MSIFKEFKRRNVFKVAIAYLIVSWLLIQIVAVVSPILELPDVFSKMILILLLVGFPVSLVLAWAFELTPEGIKRSLDVPEEHSISHLTNRKIDFIIIRCNDFDYCENDVRTPYPGYFSYFNLYTLYPIYNRTYS